LLDKKIPLNPFPGLQWYYAQKNLKKEVLYD